MKPDDRRRNNKGKGRPAVAAPRVHISVTVSQETHADLRSAPRQAGRLIDAWRLAAKKGEPHDPNL